MLRSWKARAAAGFAAVLSAGMVVGIAGPASAASNAENATLCQKGGWESLVREDQTTFANQGECVRYAAQSGVPTTPFLPTCLDSSYDYLDIKLEAPVDTTNNLGVYASDNGTCTDRLGISSTYVQAADATTASAKCVAIEGSGSYAGGNMPTFGYAAPSDYWFCQDV